MAFDYRSQLEERRFARHGASTVIEWRVRCWPGRRRASRHGYRPVFGVLIDGRLSSAAVVAAAGCGLAPGSAGRLPLIALAGVFFRGRAGWRRAPGENTGLSMW